MFLKLNPCYRNSRPYREPLLSSMASFLISVGLEPIFVLQKYAKCDMLQNPVIDTISLMGILVFCK